MTETLHLLLLTHSYSPEDTAPQRRWSGFVKELIDDGFQVTVVAPEPRKNRSVWGSETGEFGERILRVPGSQSAKTRAGRLLNNVIGSIASIPRALTVRDVDVVIATVPALTTAPVGLLVAKLKDRPFVLEMRDAWPDLARDAQLPRNLLRMGMERVLSYSQKSADLVVTVTEGFAAALNSRGVSKTVCVPNGVTHRDWNVPVHSGFVNDGKLRVLYVGNHGESQGLEIICRAAALARDYVLLTMVGSGTQKENLKQFAGAIGAPVSFEETVPSEELLSYYEQADTCVVSLRPDWPSFLWTIPSKTYELLGTSRRLTAMVVGEAAELIKQFQPDSVVPADPQKIADYWKSLVNQPSQLRVEKNPDLLQKYLPSERVVPLEQALIELSRSSENSVLQN